MRRAFITAIFLIISFLVIRSNLDISNETEKDLPPKNESYQEISGIVKKVETLFDIFKKYKLGIGELFKWKVSPRYHGKGWHQKDILWRESWIRHFRPWYKIYAS